LVDKFGVGGGDEQSEEEQAVQLIKAQGVSHKVAAGLACKPGCTRSLVRAAVGDMPREAKDPPALLVYKIKKDLQTKEAKEKEAKRKPKRTQIQKEESKPLTEEEKADILDKIQAFKKKLRRGK
jgi:hypothetical protein